MADTDFANPAMRERVAGALIELGEFDQAQQLLEQALTADPENPAVHGQLAEVHFRVGRFAPAVAAATESLSLLYFQPGLHALLGRALLATNQFAAAEQELLVAAAQSPRNLSAHEALGLLYRQHLNRPGEAFAHEGRALSLRHELATRQQPNHAPPARMEFPQAKVVVEPASRPDAAENLPAPFGADVDPRRIITVVSGLPRSGTSLMMQLLVAAGREALTDARRAADEDNPLGYLEYDKALSLAEDVSWLPKARGKVVKIVAQLLPHLPRNEHYQLIFMERNLEEVIASQRAMLARQGRPGAELEDRELAAVYRAQLERIRGQIARRPELRVLTVRYAGLLADPTAGVNRLARFLGEPFDQPAAAAAVRPELRRQVS